MAKDTQKKVWVTPIKYIGNGYIELICNISDPVGDLPVGHQMMLADVAGEMCKATGMGTADHVEYGFSVAEAVVTGDLFALLRKVGAKILHNQKLVGAYSIGDAVINITGSGAWTQAKSATANHKDYKIGIVCGPADRYEGAVLRDINDALTATEGVDICI